MSENKALALYENIENKPDALSQIAKMGEAMAVSGMFGCTKKEQGIVLAMACVTQRMSPIEVTQKYHIIGGKLTKKAGAALAEFKKMGGRYRWIKTGQEPGVDNMDREAIGEFQLGEGDPITVSFSMRDAQAAGLLKTGSAWQTLPWKMLRARVSSDAVGMLAPEIYFGDDDEPATPQPSTPLFEQRTNEKTNPEKEMANATIMEAELVQAAEPEPEPQTQPDVASTSGGGTNAGSGDATSERPPSATTEPATEAVTIIPQAEPEERSASTKAPPADTAKPPQTGSLPEGALAEVRKVVASDEAAAMRYLRQIGWLKIDQGLGDLSPAQANQIVKNAAAFMGEASKA